MYDAKLISPIGEIINIPYYEIGNYLEKVIREYISDNNDNKELFHLFESEYSYFNPYLDFALTVLGYKIQNPLIFEESILYGENGQLINKLENLIIKKVKYDRVTDYNYRIDNVDVNCLKDSTIAPNGLKFEINREKEGYHEQVYEVILIQKMIYDKNLYEDYINCLSNSIYSNIYTNINVYFRRRLGYAKVVVYDDNSGFILYDKALKDGYLENFLSSVSDFYPKIEMADEDLRDLLPEEEVEKAIQMKQEVGEKYESRRIQF